MPGTFRCCCLRLGRCAVRVTSPRPDGRAKAVLAGVTTMMPYDSYRLYRAGRVRCPAEIRCADERAAQVASAVMWLVRPFTLAVRAARRSYPAAGHGRASRRVEPAA